MTNDGIGFLGAGTSDNRISGEDMQHNRQARTADEAPTEHRMMTQERESGGPMKQHLDHEKMRHDQAMEHHKSHMERHHNRPYDSQHGQDQYKYEKR